MGCASRGGRGTDLSTGDCTTRKRPSAVSCCFAGPELALARYHGPAVRSNGSARDGRLGLQHLPADG